MCLQVARGGIASFAVSAVDIALWDLRGKRAGEPLWRLLGGFDNTTKCYAGGIDLGYDEAKLLRGVDANLAKGFNGIKIKLGRATLEEDIARVKAVRGRIGPECSFSGEYTRTQIPEFTPVVEWVIYGICLPRSRYARG